MEDLKGRQIGDYQIIEQIGKGGMASVFRAYQPSLERDVAIKILPPYYAQQDQTFIQRFKREAKAIANLRHPNILMVLEAGEQDDLAYIVMEYVTAGTLKERLQRPITLKEIYSLVRQIASALEHAHERGIVHRDIKPANIMLPKPDWALLTDFGLAHMVGGSMLTQSGMTVGTPAYMSPEQGRGERVDHRTDIYSLGIMLYEMTVGEVPYTAETPMAVVVKHIVDPLPIPRDKNPQIPEELQRIILKALAKNPDDRYQSAGEMAEALERVATSHPDWSAAEMKAVNAVRKLPADQPETYQLDEEDLDAGPADAPTLPPVPGAAPVPSVLPPTQTEAVPSGSQTSAKPKKKKRRWPLVVGGLIVLVFCSLLGLAALSNILDRETAEQANNPNLEMNANPGSDTFEFAAVEGEGEAPEDQPEVEDLLLQEFDRIAELIDQGDLERARLVFNQLSERFPRAWELFVIRRVDPLNEKGETEQALFLLEAGLAVNPDAPPEDYERVGFMYWEMGKLSEALRAFELTIQQYPWYAPAYRDIEYAVMDLDAGMLPEAIEKLEKMAERNKEGALFHTLGNLYYYDGQDDRAMMNWHEAKDRYRQALESGNQTAWNAFGLATMLYFVGEDPDQMAQLLKDAERAGLKENNLRLLEEIGWLYAEMEDCGNSERVFTAIKENFPGYVKPVELRELCP